MFDINAVEIITPAIQAAADQVRYCPGADLFDTAAGAAELAALEGDRVGDILGKADRQRKIRAVCLNRPALYGKSPGQVVQLQPPVDMVKAGIANSSAGPDGGPSDAGASTC